jgi:hypothetical protein
MQIRLFKGSLESFGALEDGILLHGGRDQVCLGHMIVFIASKSCHHDADASLVLLETVRRAASSSTILFRRNGPANSWRDIS